MIVLKNTPNNQIFYILRNSKNGSDCLDLTHSNVEYNSNGTFTIAPPAGYDGLSSVTVKVDVKCSGITTSESEINSAKEGGEHIIGISSSSAWTATASEDWITVTPSSGEGGVAVVVITVSENEGDERTGTVTIVNDNGDVNVIEIIQEGDLSSEYFTIEALTDGKIFFWYENESDDDQNWTKEIEYSRDKKQWISVESYSSPAILAELNAGDKIYLRGDNQSYSKDRHHFNHLIGTLQVKLSGNIMSLIQKEHFSNLKELTADYTFCKLFKGLNVINANSLILPATTLANWCYERMFLDCANLTTVPELPATTLTEGCYYGMFSNCTSLTTTPELPAASLAMGCYGAMFYNCISLIIPPVLPATTLAESCYIDMFQGCTSLTTAPALPARTLADYCYDSMFYNCTNLTEPPMLPATNLAEACYIRMFWNCTSLITAPQLPATTLVSGCYSYMFRGCTSLTTAPQLPATSLAMSCYYYMFFDCSSLNYIKCLATDISAFDCTNDWVNGVASSGIFVCPDPSVWTTGTDGIPSNWTIETI